MAEDRTYDARTVALIVAGGKGVRAGGGLPKQYRMLGDKAVIAHAYDSLAAHPAIEAVILVVGADQEALLSQALGARRPDIVVTGGAERQDSVRAGLEAIAAAGGAAAVLIHDAARPFVSPAVIDALLEAVAQGEGAIPALPIADTLVRGAEGIAGETVDRTGLFAVQTPQALPFAAILDVHRAWSGTRAATDDAQIARAAGIRVRLVPGDRGLDKLTQPGDFARMESQLQTQLVSRSGIGFDVHRFAAGQELWVGGILIPHDKGLSGHSDADVALHALVDAMLGALAEGDIGTHFPPSDPQWKDAPSSRFVEYARDRVLARGGRIDHVDVTIICEAPKIGPHRAAIRTRIAALLGITEAKVSIKATTTEHLGFTGRGEGMAAQAIATLRLPED